MDIELERHIRERAYLLWIEEGQPEGKAEVHWQIASNLLIGAQEPAVSMRELSGTEERHDQKAKKMPAKRRPSAKGRKS